MLFFLGSIQCVCVLHLLPLRTFYAEKFSDEMEMQWISHFVDCVEKLDVEEKNDLMSENDCVDVRKSAINECFLRKSDANVHLSNELTDIVDQFLSKQTQKIKWEEWPKSETWKTENDFLSVILCVNMLAYFKDLWVKSRAGNLLNRVENNYDNDNSNYIYLLNLTNHFQNYHNIQFHQIIQYY